MKNLVKASSLFLTGWLVMTGCGNEAAQETSQLDIVGGQTVSDSLYQTYFTSIASIQYGSSHFCGGTLIESNKILTAAHCLAGLSSSQISNLKIVLGTNDLRSSGETFGVADYNIDRRYNSNSNQYDVATITLNGNSSYTPAPVNTNSSFPAVDSTVYVAGWGATSEGGSGTSSLKYTGVKVVSNSDCASAYGNSIYSGNICAYAASTDSCQGDSGGPLYSYDGEKLTVVGVVSWGYGCARSGYPGVYARTSEFF